MSKEYFSTKTFSYICCNRDRWEKIKYLIGEDELYFNHNNFSNFINRLIDETYSNKKSPLGV